MVPTQLTDLDELVHGIRDLNSRVYISEAVHAYRNGLGRAAIILTWTALAYDLIAKFRELADHGEAAAVTFVKDLDLAIANQNVTALQQTEGKLLKLARDPFELIDDRELAALERLREDRHLCAHPAFTGDSLLFSPTPELVRTHIVQSVRFVLLHAPLQGKSAFERLRVDLLQASFPTDQVQVTTFLQTRYFSRLKPSLIGKLIAILLKEIVLQPDSDLAKVGPNLVRALMAAAEKYPNEYQTGIKRDLVKFAASADDTKLWRVVVIFGKDPKTWDWLDDPTRIKIENLVRTCKDGFQRLRFAHKVPKLAPLVESTYAALDSDGKEKFISVCPIEPVIDDAIKFFGESGSYRGAEGRARNLIIPVADIMSPAQIRSTLQAVLDNGQIWDAAEMPETIHKFFLLTKKHIDLTKDDWRAFLDDVQKLDKVEAWEPIRTKLPA